MRLLIATGALSAASFLAACQPGATPTGFDMIVSQASLQQSYLGLTSFAAFESAATTIRNSATFQAQNFIWPGTSTRHYSLDTANVEYAHAVGLDGSGEVISVIDGGFLQTHIELATKTIHTPSGFTPGADDHGTGVAATAASDGSTGNMVGVAPGADLALGHFNSFASMAAATDQARGLGAIVQNNSWGYTLDATQSNYNGVFGGTSGQNYITALRNFADSGIIVFAASNDNSLNQTDLVAGLPMFMPDIEDSFITAVNAVPSFNGSGNITSAQLLSSACLQAARWCMAADGSVYSAYYDASAPSNSDYMLWSGTSFAAPQISGAVALLAQAFPTLSAQELRARLIASADNSFFTHTDYVNFGNGIQHGYNSQFGHGFLDIAAALLPIGGSYIPRANGGAMAMDTPLVVTNGASGNAISARLADHNIVFTDGLGSEFDAPANILTAHGAANTDPNAFLSTQMALADLGGARAIGSAFADSVMGQDLDLTIGNIELSMLLPVAGFDASNLGVEMRSTAENGMRFGLSGLLENGSMLGVRPGDTSANFQSLQWSASLDMTLASNANSSLTAGARAGIAMPLSQTAGYALTTASFNEIGLRYDATGLATAGDQLSLHASLPQAVTGGSAEFVLPVAMSSGTPEFRSIDVSLAPTARQLDLGFDYTRPLSNNAQLVISGLHSINHGNIEGLQDTSAAIGWRIDF